MPASLAASRKVDPHRKCVRTEEYRQCQFMRGNCPKSRLLSILRARSIRGLPRHIVCGRDRRGGKASNHICPRAPIGREGSVNLVGGLRSSEGKIHFPFTFRIPVRFSAFRAFFLTTLFSSHPADFQCFRMEAEVGIEPTHDGFANRPKPWKLGAFINLPIGNLLATYWHFVNQWHGEEAEIQDHRHSRWWLSGLFGPQSVCSARHKTSDPEGDPRA